MAKDRRLRDLGALHLRGLLGAPSSSSREKCAHGFMAAAQRSMRLAEDRLVAHQLAAHAPPLRALPAHHEGDARRVLRGAARKTVRTFRLSCFTPKPSSSCTSSAIELVTTVSRYG